MAHTPVIWHSIDLLTPSTLLIIMPIHDMCMLYGDYQDDVITIKFVVITYIEIIMVSS